MTKSDLKYNEKTPPHVCLIASYVHVSQMSVDKTSWNIYKPQEFVYEADGF